MHHDVFNGPPDDRQSTEHIQTSRFRPRYRSLTEQEKVLHDEIKNKASELEGLLNLAPEGRYRALALTALEESVMWVVKGITE